MFLLNSSAVGDRKLRDRAGCFFFSLPTGTGNSLCYWVLPGIFDVTVMSYIHKFLNNARDLVQNNMAANVLILPGMTRKGSMRIYARHMHAHAHASAEPGIVRKTINDDTPYKLTLC